MVDEGKVAASDVCIFEMTERVGGRLMSLRGLGPDGDLIVDAGGYRTVSLSPQIWCVSYKVPSLHLVAGIYSNGTRLDHRLSQNSNGVLRSHASSLSGIQHY